MSFRKKFQVKSQPTGPAKSVGCCRVSPAAPGPATLDLQRGYSVNPDGRIQASILTTWVESAWRQRVRRGRRQSPAPDAAIGRGLAGGPEAP